MKAGRLANSLVVRMFALILAILAVGGAVNYVLLTRFLTRDLTEVSVARQSALADYVSRDIAGSLRDRLQVLERLAAALPPALLATPDALCPWLAERDGLHPTFPLGFAVADDHGRVRGRCATDLSHGAVTRADADLRGALTGASVIGRPFRDATSGRPALSFAVPIRHWNGASRGVLLGVAEIGGGGFLDLRSQGQIGRSGGLLLVSPADRLFVSATEADMFFKPTPPDGVNLLHDRAMAGYRGSGLTLNASGIEEISAVVSVPGTRWFVVARSPTREALATVARAQSLILSQRVPLMLLIMSVVMGLMTWWLRPLFRAARQAERMTRGELPLSPIPVVRNDEIGHLTAAFNRLIAKLDQQQGELARLAHHDGLTGLANRRLFADRAQQASSRARRHGTRLAILFLDLDGFKQINDGLGHEIGDDALRQIAARLVAAVRGTDTVARLGGDEFVILASDLAAGEDASVQVLVDKCTAAVAEPMSLARGATRRLGVSVGVAFSDGHLSIDDLLAAADRAMYAAKTKRRTQAAGFAVGAGVSFAGGLADHAAR